jgi:hypothetical protein
MNELKNNYRDLNYDSLKTYQGEYQRNGEAVANSKGNQKRIRVTS